jgi:flavin-dependent dehydrogenase
MTDAVIVGGGPAGAAAACVLARADRDVVVLERDTAPSHKICGEFLGGVALRQLFSLGIDVAALGAHRIDRLRLVRGARVIATELPFEAAGLSRRRMDEALLDAAIAAGATVRRGTRVEGFRDGAVVTADHRYSAGAVLLATGKHDLREVRRTLKKPPEALVGFKMHFRLSAAERAELAGHIELILFDDAYAGLQPIEDGMANLCLLVDSARFAAAGSRWEGLIADLTRESPHLRRRLGDASELFDHPLAIARVPYGFVHSEGAEDGVFRLGDQMGVIPSFCGEGLAIALHSGAAAGRWIAAGGSSAAFHARMRRDMSRQIRLASSLYRLGRMRVGQAAMLAAAALWPGALSRLAAATRIGSG